MKAKTAEAKREPRSTDKRKRPAVYYHLSEKDWPVIIEGLRRFASLYHIALKIGCGYSTLKKYIHEHPELVKVQEEARVAIDDFVASQIVRKCASGYFPALAFYAERKMGWTQHQTIENVGALPVINFGLIPESQLPPEKDDSEVRALEDEFMRGEKEADKARKDAQDASEGTEESEDGFDEDEDTHDDKDEDSADFFGASADDDFEGGMFG